jgi:CoA:oxalate CoA-transferase
MDRPLTVTRSGFKLSGGDPDVATPPPRLGEHTEELLDSLGFSADDIAGLRAEGAI